VSWNDLAENKFVLAIFTATCGFLLALFLERIKARKAPRKQLSWEASVDDRLLQVREGTAVGKIKIRYGPTEVQNLTQVFASFENTGTSVIKNQYIRFRFPEEAKILEVSLDPVPEPELGVSEVDDAKLPPQERRYLVAHLEVGQSVRYRIVSDGGKWLTWDGVHPFNDEGGVEFLRRDAARNREDEEEVAPFLQGSAMLVTLLAITAALPEITKVIPASVAVLIAFYLSKKVPAIARVLGRLLAGRSGNSVWVTNSQGIMIGDNGQQSNDYARPPQQSSP
jgi:hypothetical protein